MLEQRAAQVAAAHTLNLVAELEQLVKDLLVGVDLPVVPRIIQVVGVAEQGLLVQREPQGLLAMAELDLLVQYQE
jgi:hypothetical protein